MYERTVIERLKKRTKCRISEEQSVSGKVEDMEIKFFSGNVIAEQKEEICLQHSQTWKRYTVDWITLFKRQ